MDDVRVLFADVQRKSDRARFFDIDCRLGYEYGSLIHITSPPSREIVLMTLDVTLPTRVCDYFCVVGCEGKHFLSFQMLHPCTFVARPPLAPSALNAEVKEPATELLYCDPIQKNHFLSL